MNCHPGHRDLVEGGAPAHSCHWYLVEGSPSHPRHRDLVEGSSPHARHWDLLMPLADPRHGDHLGPSADPVHSHTVHQQVEGRADLDSLCEVEANKGKGRASNIFSRLQKDCPRNSLQGDPSGLRQHLIEFYLTVQCLPILLEEMQIWHNRNVMGRHGGIPKSKSTRNSLIMVDPVSFFHVVEDFDCSHPSLRLYSAPTMRSGGGFHCSAPTWPWGSCPPWAPPSW